MSITKRSEAFGSPLKGLSLAVSVCLVVGGLAGCTSAADTKSSFTGSYVGCGSLLEDEWSQPPQPTQTDGYIVDFWSPYDTLDSLIEGSSAVIAGCVQDWRYEPTTDGLEVQTILTVEVMGVFTGALQPGDKIEIYELGGVKDGTLWRDDKLPYLRDHRGEDLVLFLRQYDVASGRHPAYGTTDPLKGAWLHDSGRLTVLRANGQAFGLPSYPDTLTTEELEQAVARVK